MSGQKSEWEVDREVIEAATPGPWSCGWAKGSADDGTGTHVTAPEQQRHLAIVGTRADAVFVVRARERWPAERAENERLREGIEALAGEVGASWVEDRLRALLNQPDNHPLT